MKLLSQIMITSMLLLSISALKAQTTLKSEEIWRYGRGVISSFEWIEEILAVTTDGDVWHINILEDMEPVLHTSDVNSRVIAIHPDGTYFITYDARSILLWNSQTQSVVASIDSADILPQTIVWEPSGNLMAISVYDDVTSPEVPYRVELWDIEKGERSRVVGEYRERILAIDWHPEGQMLAVRQHDGTITIEDLASDVTKAEFQTMGTGRPMVAWNADGTLLAATSTLDVPTYIWRTDTFELISSTATPSFTRVLDWHDDNTRLVGDLFDSGIGIWDTESNELMAFGIEGNNNIDRFIVDVSWNEELVAALDSTQRLRVWNVASDELLWDSNTHQFHSDVTSLAINSEGSQVAIGYRDDRTIAVVDIESGLLQQTLLPDESVRGFRGTTELAWSYSGQQLAVIDDHLSILTLEPDLPVNSIRIENITDFSWSPNGILAVWTDGQGLLRLVNSETGELMNTMPMAERGQVKWSPNGDYLAYSYRYVSESDSTLPYGHLEVLDNQLNILTSIDFSNLSIFAQQPNQDFSWMPDSSGFIGYTNGSFWRWHIETEELEIIASEVDTTNQPALYSINPSGELLAISNVTTNWQIHILDVETGEFLLAIDDLTDGSRLLEWAGDDLLLIYDGILHAYQIN